jgi:hypothetical protein
MDVQRFRRSVGILVGELQTESRGAPIDAPHVHRVIERICEYFPDLYPWCRGETRQNRAEP